VERRHWQSTGQLSRQTAGGDNVITRLWSAKATETGSKDYLEHFNNAVLPELRKLEGYAGSSVLTRVTNGELEILVATVWHSLQAIQQFAGTDLDGAVVASEAAGILADYDRRVRHFEVALIDVAANAP
jgi:heme-degrading monooxygenase HmoA